MRSALTETFSEIKAHLTTSIEETAVTDERPKADIVATGTFDEINAEFSAKGWSDGLPIVPPTEARVAAFLAHTDDDPDRRIGVLPPSGSAATVRNVAVNGVMAGCPPETMPVLVAIAEIMAEPGYGVEHSGDTTDGMDALIDSSMRYTTGDVRVKLFKGSAIVTGRRSPLRTSKLLLPTPSSSAPLVWPGACARY